MSAPRNAPPPPPRHRDAAVRQSAPHVRSAIAATLQQQPAPRSEPAAHVRRALAVQGKHPAPGEPRPPAAHVRKAIAAPSPATLQRQPEPRAQPAAHVQRALAQNQGQRSAPAAHLRAPALQGRMAPAPHVQAAFGPRATSGSSPVAPRVAGAHASSPPPLSNGGVLQRMESKFFVEETKSRYSGRNDSGVVFGTGPVLREPRSYRSQEDVRFLRYISTFFFHYVNAYCRGDAEVEAMLLADRLLLSSNSPRAMRELFELMKTEPTLLDTLRSQPPPETDTRGVRVNENLYQIISTPEPRSEAALLLQSLSLEDIGDSLRLVGPSKVSEVLTSPDYSEKLILVEGLNIHAEQKLMLALVGSSLPKSTQVIIRGKKRPCFGCWLCLNFVKEVAGFSNLEFNARPGKAWVGSIKSIERLFEVATKAGVGKQTVIAWLEEKKRQFDSFQTFVTVSGSGGEDPAYDTESDDDPW